MECLSAAKGLISLGSYKDAANRAYYAIFHVMRSVLAFDEIDMKHHSGIMAQFRRLYIKTGIFDKELSNIITEAFTIRSDSDYDDFFIVSKSEVEEQVQNAEFFLKTIQSYLQTKSPLEESNE